MCIEVQAPVLRYSVGHCAEWHRWPHPVSILWPRTKRLRMEWRRCLSCALWVPGRPMFGTLDSYLLGHWPTGQRFYDALYVDAMQGDPSQVGQAAES